MQSSIIVCDDIRVEYNGKLIMVGVYTADIAIPVNPFIAGQLQFYFMFECDVEEIPQNLTFEVTLPGQKSVQWALPIPKDFNVQEGRKRLYMRQPCVIVAPVLTPGRIEAKVIHDKGELPAMGMWIVHMPQLIPTNQSARQAD